MVSIPEPDRKYSYKDYLSWSDHERWELIDGNPFNMTPAPSPEHQRILRGLLTEFDNHLKYKTCEVFPAPFDVRLFPNDLNMDANVVQPDLTVVCNPDLITHTGCEGVPDLVVEILSPSTAKKDKGVKKKLYERAGIKAYWIVDPLNHTVEIFSLGQNGCYETADVYGSEDEIHVKTMDELKINLKSVFRVSI